MKITMSSKEIQQGEKISMTDMDTKQNCFMSTLARLKESSNDAVVSADFTDPYMIYMHVDRPVQEDFTNVLKKSNESNEAELILLCGSVGDGKSHILSYCRHLYPDIMNQFYVHNDSTASLYSDKPASYTLFEILEEFSDEKIDSSKQKTIIAINLGTLNNFLEADVQNRFKRLKKYVQEIGILDGQKKVCEETRHFHSVNFADYHLYELTNAGPTSDYLLKLLKKITSEDVNNVYYQGYCECCATCETAKVCPVKANFDLLSNELIQKGIAQVIIENIVKNKMLISTRKLLNFIYEIIVDERVLDVGSFAPRKQPQKINTIEYINALLPNMLFGRTNASEVFKSISINDPMKIRNEDVDSFFVEYENTQDVFKIFTGDLYEYEYLLEKFIDKDISEPSMYTVKSALRQLYIRLCWLTNKRTDLLPEDEDYKEYMAALYAWNRGDVHALKSVCVNIGRALMAWNGQANKGEMQLNVGNNQSQYHLFQNIELKPNYLSFVKKQDEVLSAFKDELVLRFDSSGISLDLEIDYALFSLLKKVTKGYVPNSSDKKMNIKCVEFIKRISQGGSKMDKVFIRDLSQKQIKEYLLTFDGIDYSFEVN